VTCGTIEGEEGVRMNEKYSWSDFEIAKAVLWNLETKGYVDTNVDDFERMLKEAEDWQVVE